MNDTRSRLTRSIRDRGVATKITASVAIAVVVAVVVEVLGLQSLSASANRTAAMYTQNTLGAQPAEELPRMASDLRTTVSRFTY